MIRLAVRRPRNPEKRRRGIPQARINGSMFYYEVHGQGRPLIMIMGLGRGVEGWQSQIPDLSRYYQVIVFDHRGIGRTPGRDGPVTIESMTEDVLGLLDTLHIERAHVVGKSMGGYVAQELAITHPERVDRLVLASTSPGAYTLDTPFLMSWVARVLPAASQRFIFQLMLPFLFRDSTFEDPAMVKLAVDIISGRNRPEANQVLASQLVACAAHSTRGRLHRISSPTLVLVGAEDFFVPFSLAREPADSIPCARLMVLDGGGHNLNEDIPGEFNRAVVEFLAEFA